MIEIFSSIMAIATWIVLNDPISFIVYYCLLILPLIIISFIDLKHLIILDSISITGIFVGCAVHVFLGSGDTWLENVIDSLAGILVGGGILFIVAFVYEKLKKEEGLGGGDIKLIAMLGAFFGWRAIIFILLGSSIMGSIAGLITILIMRKGMKYPIPYGPFLAVAGVIYLFWGWKIMTWYLTFFR